MTLIILILLALLLGISGGQALLIVAGFGVLAWAAGHVERWCVVGSHTRRGRWTAGAISLGFMLLCFWIQAGGR